MKEQKKKIVTRLYRIRNYCNPKYGRGFTVCPTWLDPVHGLDNFINDVGYPPTETAQLMRKDVKGNYTKDNLRWLVNTPERILAKERLGSIIDKCTNPNNISYKTYGGRGIYVCDRWREPNSSGLDNFMEDMGPRPGKEYFLCRIDKTGPYSPDNCKWEVIDKQQGNKKTKGLRYYEVEGELLTGAQIAEIVGNGCTAVHIWRRYKQGIRGKDLLEPLREVLTHDTPYGKLTIHEISARTGISTGTLYARSYRIPNITWEELVRSPKYKSRKSTEFITTLGPFTIDQLRSIIDVSETETYRRLQEGMTGLELFTTKYKTKTTYIKAYGYMGFAEYRKATGYSNGISSKMRTVLSETGGLLTMNSTFVHELSDGERITTLDLLERTKLKPETLAWLLVRYGIPAEVLWQLGTIEEYLVPTVIDSFTTTKPYSLSSNKFKALLTVQLLRCGLDSRKINHLESTVRTMMSRIGIPDRRYDLVYLFGSLIGAVESIYGDNIRVHVPETDTTEHQFIMSPTTGVGLIKKNDDTYSFVEY